MQVVQSSLTIPDKLRDTLPDAESPWLMSKAVFSRVGSAPLHDGVYRKCEIYKTDQEWAFIHRYFDSQRPTNRSIMRIYAIHNPASTKQFEASIVSIEAQAKSPAFAPHWRSEDNVDSRSLVIDRWNSYTKQFSPFAIPSHDGRQTKILYYHTKLLPLWHGTSEKVCDSICKTGFTVFGKHEEVHKDDNDKGKQIVKDPSTPKSTDIGFFGSGMYFSTSAKYAAQVYSDGNLLLAWVSTSEEPYPVIADVQCVPPKEPSDMKKLKGLGGYQNYNTHFIPVVPVDSNDPHCAIYYPCAKGQTPALDEIVVFNKGQTLAQFWVVLAIDMTKEVSENSGSVGTSNSVFLKKLYEILDSPLVQEDAVLCKIIETEIKQVAEEDGDAIILPDQRRFFNIIDNLFTTAGAVRSIVAKQLKELHTEFTSASPKFQASLKPPKSPSSKGQEEEKNISESLSPESCTDLVEASAKGQIEQVRFFLDTKSDTSKVDLEGNTALIRATQKNHLDVATLLLASKAKVDQEDTNQYTALMHAAEKGHSSMIELLFNYKANVNHIGKKEHTVLIKAVIGSHEDAIKSLIKIKADVNSADVNKPVPLDYPKESKIAEILITAKAEVVRFDKNGLYFDALFCAAAAGRINVMVLLLKHFKQPEHIVRSNLNSALVNACFEPDEETTIEKQIDAAKFLLQSKADVNGNSNGAPLKQAVRHRSPAMTQFLLENKADVNIGSYPAINTATEYGSVDVVRLLIEAKANVNNNYTLFHAAKRGHKEMVQLLLMSKAHAVPADISVAKSNGHNEVSRMLERAKSNDCVIQ